MKLALAVPPGVLTVTVTVPALPGGLVTVICVPESPAIFAVTPPKVTLVAPARLAPEIVTVVPPWVLPLDGEIAVIVGAGVT